MCVIDCYYIFGQSCLTISLGLFCVCASARETAWSHSYPAQPHRPWRKQYAFCRPAIPSSNVKSVGMYASGPFSGRVVDTRGPRPLFVYAFVCLLIGYTGIWAIFSSADKPDEEKNYGMPTVVLLMFLSFLTGTGGNAGFASAVNATAKSFPDHAVRTRIALIHPVIVLMIEICSVRLPLVSSYQDLGSLHSSSPQSRTMRSPVIQKTS